MQHVSYEKRLNQIVDAIFKEADRLNLTNTDLANEAKCCLSTVWKLAN